MTLRMGRRRSFPVESVYAAAEFVERFTRGRSSTMWYRMVGDMRGAAVEDESGAVVAYVSYNGRIHTPAAADALLAAIGEAPRGPSQRGICEECGREVNFITHSHEARS